MKAILVILGIITLTLLILVGIGRALKLFDEVEKDVYENMK